MQIQEKCEARGGRGAIKLWKVFAKGSVHILEQDAVTLRILYTPFIRSSQLMRMQCWSTFRHEKLIFGDNENCFLVTVSLLSIIREGMGASMV